LIKGDVKSVLNDWKNNKFSGISVLGFVGQLNRGHAK
jgi:hypothetical protein